MHEGQNSAPTVAIVDYGVGNLFSITQACRHVGLASVITGARKDIEAADAVILPGIGAFGRAMQMLEQLDLVHLLRDLGQGDKPVFGICLGMQLLFEASDELGHHKGLGILPGAVRRFPESVGKIPAIGWQTLEGVPHRSWENTPLTGLTPGQSSVYLLHSYFAVPAQADDVLATSRYQNVEYCCSVLRGALFGCQFHPERSGENGLKIFRSFAQTVIQKAGSVDAD